MRALLSEKLSCFYEIVLMIISRRIEFFYFRRKNVYLHLFRKKYTLGGGN